jgi:hypothetical protein
MSDWNAAQLISQQSGNSRWQLSAEIDTVLGGLQLNEGLLDAVTIETTRGAFPTSELLVGGGLIAGAKVGWSYLIKPYLKARRALVEEHARFWADILPPHYRTNCAVMTGGRKELNLVRGGLIPASQYAVFRLVSPLLTAWLEELQKDEEGYLEDIELLTEKKSKDRSAYLTPSLRWLANTIANALGYRHPGRRVKFVHNLTSKGRRLLLLHQGPITSDLASKHPVNTQSSRRYHIVARLPERPGGHDEFLPLTNKDAVRFIRAYKRSRSDRWLDRRVQYEIWGSKSALTDDDGGIRGLKRNILSPHRTSEGADVIEDAAIIVLSPSDLDKPNGRWILSILPLHPLATVAVELFWHPSLLLRGTAVKSFADAAREAGDRGFEAVLRIKRRRRSTSESLRTFEGIPLLKDVTVEVECHPRALSR